MRKFVLLLTTVVFIISLPVISQTTDKQKTMFGIKTGVNVSRFNLNGNLSDLVNADFRTGFVAGAFVNFPTKKSPISFQPEFLYSSMGGDLSTELKEKVNFRLNYFSIPVLIKYQFSKKFAAFAGPQLDAILYAERSDKFGEFDITNSVKEVDAYITGGFDYWWKRDIVLSARYMHGFKEVNTLTPNISMNNRGFQFTIGLRFRKPKPWPETVVVLPPVDKDTDGDGIFDSRDKCPTVAGVAKYEGCPVPDTDKDGIFDDKDKCPDMPGYPELDGCPYPDRDRDGVTDNKDRCPDEPGSTKNDGCPVIDRDGDGVPDATDRCPDTPGPGSNYGCPEDVKTKLTYIAKNIYFHTNKATLQNISYGPLDQLADILTRYPNAKLTIEGHTDNTGSNAYNLKLSKNRAQAVVDYLVSKGIAVSRLNAVGFGEDKPVTTNKTAEGRTLNRRVELILTEN
ncbi:MAG TPA: OmpA family protein [Chitinophagaceae bacterium]|jgi:outer membrane protein OmpA-like peptidoglycan-associated protein|nr:OmpA family protein [Chitinophagaceae bacterium]